MDAKVIKPALEIAAKIIGDEQVSEKLDQLAPSNNTMNRRVSDLASDVHRQEPQHSHIYNFSLAMQSTDISDTAQLVAGV